MTAAASRIIWRDLLQRQQRADLDGVPLFESGMLAANAVASFAPTTSRK